MTDGNDATAGQRPRDCSACGAANDPARELCVQCGSDPETGQALPRLDPDDRPPAEPRNGFEPTGRFRWWLPVGAALAVVALVVGGLALAQVGPFEREPELPEAAFDSDWYRGDAQFLLLSDIATLTTLPPMGGRSFAPTQMVDDDRTTAWHSDGEQLSDGVGEKIDLFLAEPAWVSQIVLANGDQRDPEAYAANARMQRARITFDGGYVVVANLLDQGFEQQAVELPEPALTTTVRIEVLDTFPGDDHPNLAVSDVELRGWGADPDDAELAEERAQIMRAAGPAVLPDAVTNDSDGTGDTARGDHSS